MNSIINNELESCSDRRDIKLNHCGAISGDLGVFQRQTRRLNEGAIARCQQLLQQVESNKRGFSAR